MNISPHQTPIAVSNQCGTNSIHITINADPVSPFLHRVTVACAHDVSEKAAASVCTVTVNWTLPSSCSQGVPECRQRSPPQYRLNSTHVSPWQVTFTLRPTLGLLKPINSSLQAIRDVEFCHYYRFSCIWVVQFCQYYRLSFATTTDSHVSELCSSANTTDLVLPKLHIFMYLSCAVLPILQT